MLLFSTMLNIRNMTEDDFIRLVIEWNNTGTYRENIIPGIVWNGERNKRYGSGRLWLDIREDPSRHIIAVRHEKKADDGRIWDTDFVVNFQKKQMTVRLDRSFEADALRLDNGFSTPHFITLLIRRGYLRDDRDFPVLRDPVMITEDNLQLAVDAINGSAKHRLPIVYISKTYQNEDPVDVHRLAGRLKGVAHVLVQQDIRTNERIKELCSYRNEYNGAVGIYFSDKGSDHRRFWYRNAAGIAEHLTESVIQTVIQYSNSQMIEPLYTWQGVTNTILKDRAERESRERKTAIEAWKKAEDEKSLLEKNLSTEKQQIEARARSEADKLLEDFDDENERLRKQVNELIERNNTLTYENEGLKIKLDDAGRTPVLYMGDEFDYYQGEIKDLILEVLTDTLKNLPDDSRRAHVVRDIISHNDYQKLGEERAAKVKKLLNDYNGLTPKLRQALENLQMTITEDGKHYKVTCYGDNRYQTVLAKTPSDFRGGKNNVAEIISKIY